MKKELFKGLNIKILIIEVLIFSLLVFTIGFLINREDPLLINTGFNGIVYFLPLLVFTLFYGMVAGLLYLLIFSIATIFLYGSFPFYFFLWMILFFLLASEFHFYWSKNLREASEKYIFIDEKLRDIAREMMLLKLSHDHMEKQYILKPVSLRQIIYEIKNDVAKEDLPDRELNQKILNFVSNAYGIHTAGVVKYNFDKNSFELLSKTSEDFVFDKDNPLIEKALDSGMISSIETAENSLYLAIIPINFQDITYLILIQDMDFLNLNAESLQAINLIFYYLLIERQRQEKIKELISKFPNLSIEILTELKRLNEIYQKFKLESSLVFFSCKNHEGLEDLLELRIKKASRGLDLVEMLYLDGNLNIVCILPFTSLSGAENFVERIKDVIKDSLSESFLKENIAIRTLPINLPPERLLNLIFGE